MAKKRDKEPRSVEERRQGWTWPAVLGALGLLAWAVVVLKAYHATVPFNPSFLSKSASALCPSPLPFSFDAVLRCAWRVLCAGGVVLAAWGGGGVALAGLRLPWRDHFERAALRFGLGLGLLANGILALGWAGLLYVPVVRVFLGLLAGAGVWEYFRPAFSPASGPARAAPLMSLRWAGVFGSLLAAAGVVLVPFVFAPEVFWDAMVYHQGLPNLYLLEHRLVPTPANLYSGNILAVQMLFAAAQAVEGPVTAKLVNAGVGLSCCLFFASWARRSGRPGAGLLASAFFFLCPLVLFEFFRTSVGLGWAFFQLAAFHCVLAAAEGAPGSTERWKWWGLSGVFLGLAMSTKYPAWTLPASVILAAVLSRVRRLGLPEIHLKEAGLSVAISLLVVSPWIARNIAFYHDPAFPYLTEDYAPGGDGLCGGPGAACAFPQRDDKGWRVLNKDARARDVRSVFGTTRGLGRWLDHPWTFSVDVGNVHADGMGPLFLILLPLALLGRAGPGAPLLGALVLGAWLPLSLLSEMPRFFMPQLGPLSFLLASAVLGLARPFRDAVLAFAAVFLAVPALMSFHPPPDSREFWDVVSGRRSESEFLTRCVSSLYPGASYSGVRFINETLPPDAKVLLVGDARGLYLKRSYYSSGQFDVDTLERLANCSAGAAEMRARLLGCGVTHILVNRAELQRLRQAFRFTLEGAARFDAFWRGCTEKVFDDFAHPDHWVSVFRIMPEGERPDPARFEDIFGKGYGQRRPSGP